MLNESQKKKTQELLVQFVEGYPSQAQAAKVFKNISEANIINIRKGNWDSISDKMWRNVAEQLGHNLNGEWFAAPTANYRTGFAFFEDSRQYGNVFAIAASAGSGKSYLAEQYRLQTPHVYIITCAEYMNRKVFLQNLLEQMGRPVDGTVSELIDRTVDNLRRIERPLLILDEFDKLTDASMYFFITLYNRLKGKCGIVLMATEFLVKRIKRGRALQRKGYDEIHSRIGHTFVGFGRNTYEEIRRICQANGMDDAHAIREIFNSYEGDLRRLERLVHKHRMTTAMENAQNPLKMIQDESN